MIAEAWRKAVKLLRLLGRAEFRRGLRFGVAASLENLAAVRGLELATVIDVGANVGQFTLLATALHPGVRVYAFEPQDAAAAAYDRLFAGRPEIRLRRCAIGAEEGEAVLHLSRRADSSSLLPITERQVRFAPGTEAVGTVRVPVRTLDSLLSPADIVRPAMLKLDVQGYELPALVGAGRLLAAIDHVYAEVSFVPLYEGQALADAVIAHLAARGFSLAGVGAVSHDPDGRCVQADLLFSRRADG